MEKKPQTRPPLSALSRAELLARAQEYRRMAKSARSVWVREALLRLARRFEERARRPDADLPNRGGLRQNPEKEGGP